MSIEDLRDEHDVELDDIDEASEIDTDIDDDDDVESDDDTDTESEQDDPADELGFSFDDDGESDDSDPFAGKPAPEWVKQVRQENRELKRQLRERQQQEQPQQQALREKPTLEAYDYDAEAFEQDLEQWYGERQQYEQQAQQERQKYQQYDERYKSDVDDVRARVADYDDIEQTIVDVLPPARQAMLKIACKNPARMVVALGNSPSKLDELSKLNDVEFAFRLGQLEMQMAQTKSRNPNKPKPKSHELSGGAGGGDTKLAKLEAAADKTGDRSAVVAYKKRLRNK